MKKSGDSASRSQKEQTIKPEKRMEAASVNEGEEEFGSWRVDEEHGTKMMGRAEPYPQIRPGSLRNRPASQRRGNSKGFALRAFLAQTETRQAG
jgi:hypothetical protein